MWTYENAGNILSRKEYAYTVGTLGTVLDTVAYTYGDSDWGDLHLEVLALRRLKNIALLQKMGVPIT